MKHPRFLLLLPMLVCQLSLAPDETCPLKHVSAHAHPAPASPVSVRAHDPIEVSVLLYKGKALKIEDVSGAKGFVFAGGTPNLHFFWNEAEKVGMIVSVSGGSHAILKGLLPSGCSAMGGTRYKVAEKGQPRVRENSIILKDFNGVALQDKYFNLTLVPEE